jgi:hypothetical protein
MQLADKQTPIYATVEMLLDYDSKNGVFYVVRAEMLQAGEFEAAS